VAPIASVAVAVATVAVVAVDAVAAVAACATGRTRTTRRRSTSSGRRRANVPTSARSSRGNSDVLVEVAAVAVRRRRRRVGAVDAVAWVLHCKHLFGCLYCNWKRRKERQKISLVSALHGNSELLRSHANTLQTTPPLHLRCSRARPVNPPCSVKLRPNR